MSRTESEFRGNTSYDLQDPIDMKTMVLLNKLYTKFIVDMIALEVCLQVLITVKPSNYLLFQSRQKHKKECEICSELTIKTPKRRSDVVLMFLLLTLNIFHTFSQCFCCWLWTDKCLFGKDWFFSHLRPSRIDLET